MLLNLYLPQVQRVLEAGGVEVRVLFTRREGHAAQLVRKHREGADCVIVFGGDGTVREAVAGMGQRPLPLGIIPFGTVNVLALDLGIPANPLAAARTLLAGHTRWIDVGYLDGEPFLLMVSTGIDAMAVHNLDFRAKQYFGQMAYMFSALWTALTDRPQRIRVRIDRDGARDSGYLAIISNSRYYAGPYRIAAETRIDDGLLNVLLFKKRGVLDTLRLFLGVLTRRHRLMRDVVFYSGREIRITSRSRVKMQMDGDKAPPTPARVWVEPGVLPVFVPQKERRNAVGEVRRPGRRPRRASTAG
jgi:YegS/Rv2252/BmrU family lipid kinase